jgi:hypothetical protein
VEPILDPGGRRPGRGPNSKAMGRVEFGAIEATRDECRQAWGWQRIDEFRAELRYTLRGLRRNPAFSATAILSLALGIGANTAIFGLVDAVMLRQLPVRDPGARNSSRTALHAGGGIDKNGAPRRQQSRPIARHRAKVRCGS